MDGGSRFKEPHVLQQPPHAGDNMDGEWLRIPSFRGLRMSLRESGPKESLFMRLSGITQKHVSKFCVKIENGTEQARGRKEFA